MLKQSKAKLEGRRAWSFSKLKAFELCPRKFQALYITKEVKEQPSEATMQGEQIHKMFEKRIRDKVKFPKGYEKFEKFAEPFDEWPGEVHVEQKYALSLALKPVEFFANNVHSRAIADVLAVFKDLGVLIDWKTGKNRGFEDGTQLKLAAYHAFKQFPLVKRITASYIWVSNGDRSTIEIARGDMPEIWSEFLPRLERLEEAYGEDEWQPQPNSLCRMYCPVKSCVHNGDYQTT